MTLGSVGNATIKPIISVSCLLDNKLNIFNTFGNEYEGQEEVAKQLELHLRHFSPHTFVLIVTE